MITGLLTTVYGYDELHFRTKPCACIWLLHGRLQSQEYMEPLATSLIESWNKQCYDGTTLDSRQRGLLAVSFDQRNHGSRLVDKEANKTWDEGNKAHAQDMFTTYLTFARLGCTAKSEVYN
jgi:alpha-beta hydrolase superfamily lysophospholipase